MNDWLVSGGAAGAGGFFGILASWLGFRQRLDAQDKLIDKLASNVVYEDTCKATTSGFGRRLDDQGKLLSEMREDIKTLLRRNT